MFQLTARSPQRVVRLATIFSLLILSLATSATAEAASYPGSLGPTGSVGPWLGSGDSVLGGRYAVTCTGSGFQARGVVLESQKIGRSPGSNFKQDIWMQATLWSTTDFRTWSYEPKPWQKREVDANLWSYAKFNAENWPQPTKKAYFLVRIEVRWYNTPSTSTSWLGTLIDGYSANWIQPFNAVTYSLTTGDGACWLF